MKLPYGISDFQLIREEGYFYQDRTDRIPLLEEAGRQLLLIRPRRFGKSLLLSMLENYYDVAQREDFERLFGSLAIGRQPTSSHNRYLVMKWDFSLIKAVGGISAVEAAIHEHLNDRIAHCAGYYGLSVPIKPDNAISSFEGLLSALKTAGHKLYLLIDEYDNFANEIMMTHQTHYEALLYGEGLLKTVFKAVKAAAGGMGLDRVLITGVSPVVMSDLTSGYNVAVNIYLNPKFNSLCGFTETEIQMLLQTATSEPQLTEVQALIKTYYNGYHFAESIAESVYNPTLSLYFLSYWQEHQTYPRDMLDNNLMMDRNKLNYIAALPHGERVLLKVLNESCITLDALSQRFGVEDMLSLPKDETFMVSLLYYFGILTLAGRTDYGELALKIPNLVIRKLYVEKLQDLLLPEFEDRQTLKAITDAWYQRAELQPLCTFIETRYFALLSNRDYRWSNELLLKFAFLSLVFNDTYYMMVSEAEVGRGYLDLGMILRPQMRQYRLWDLLIEFKYLKLSELSVERSILVQSDLTSLSALPAVADKLQEGRIQAHQYAAELTRHYGELKLRSFVVVALGFDRLVWQEVHA